MRYKGLTPKQQAFVEEYLVDFNGTQAAIRAGYSAKTANRIACQNLSKLDIQNAIQAAQADRGQRLGITADRIDMALARLAFTEANEPPRTSDILRALEILARRYCGPEEQQVGMTEEERAALIRDIENETLQ